MAAISSGDGSLYVDKQLHAPELKDMSQLLTARMVDIFVGAERKRFHLHHDLLCDRSAYFKACFAGNFKEADQKELYFPEDDIESFGLFVRWLYDAALNNISSKDELPVYFSLFILANKLCLEYLRNKTIDHILRFHRKIPVSIDYRTLHFIYQNTSDRDRIRKYLVELAAWTTVLEHVAGLTADEQRLIGEGGDLAIDFTASLLMFYAGGNPHDRYWDDPQRRPNCSYHKHDSTPICAGTSLHQLQSTSTLDYSDEWNI